MRALALQFESGRNILRFYRARSEALDRSRGRGDHAGARESVAEMQALVRREREISDEMTALAREDSRLGFHSEAEVHQYHPAKLAWRIAALDDTLADLVRIDAALARGEPYPQSDFERGAPACRIGGGWTEGDGLRLRVEETPGGDLRILVRTASREAVSAYAFDAAGAAWPRGARIASDGEVDSPIPLHATASGLAATGTVARDGGEYAYALTLAAEGWNRDTRLRPGWLQLRLGDKPAWPALPAAPYRLNLGSIRGDRFGRLVR